MDLIIAICAFAGAWFLVAGPVWQASIELREEEIDQELWQRTRVETEIVPRASRWWWLLPPVAYVLEMRRSRINRRAFNAALPPDQLEHATSFLNKANGWFTVALGAFLLAIAETWNLVEKELEWPQWVFWVAVVVLTIASLANAVIRTGLTQHVLQTTAAQRASD